MSDSSPPFFFQMETKTQNVHIVYSLFVKLKVKSYSLMFIFFVNLLSIINSQNMKMISLIIINVFLIWFTKIDSEIFNLQQIYIILRYNVVA